MSRGGCVNPYLADADVTLYHGDALDVLPLLDTVDAVVTDPPYGLRFMGQRWDADVPSVELWQLVFERMKPGAHLLAFAGTRTQHRMACNIDDAGFEIRDMIGWVYGQGFPKSLDVSKAIDRRGGSVAGFADFRDAVKAAMLRNGVSRQQLQDALGNFMLSHYLTAGSQPAVPLLRDYRIIRDTVGLGREFDKLFNDEAEREVVGTKTSGIANKNEGPRHTIGAGKAINVAITAAATDAARQWEGWGTALKPSLEPITVARKPLEGTVAENVLRHGTGGLNVAGCRVGTEGGVRKVAPDPSGGAFGGAGFGCNGPVEPVGGRWPSNLIHDGSDEVEALFPQSNDSRPPRTLRRGTRDDGWGMADQAGELRDAGSGSAARFYYCSKASKADRGYGNTHSTVKPIDLMRYLCRLVAPPGGVVLDPFAGSGSTLLAARLEGFRAIGIELELEHCETTARRLAQQSLLVPA